MTGLGFNDPNYGAPRLDALLKENPRILKDILDFFIISSTKLHKIYSRIFVSQSILGNRQSRLGKMLGTSQWKYNESATSSYLHKLGSSI